MIDKVLILGIRRANQLIPDHEIGQMVGRCGRSYTESGEATLIVPENELEIANEYMFGKPKPISSSMHEISNLAFHCIPEIHHQTVYNKESFDRWYSRTLSFLQGKKGDWEEVKNFLEQNEAIRIEGDRVVLSELGEVSFRFYYPPDRITLLKEKMELVANSLLQKDENAISWMLSWQHYSIGEANALELSEYKSDVNSLGLFFYRGELIDGYAYRSLLTAKKPKWLKFQIENLKKDIDRLLGAIKRISEIRNIPFGNSIDVWKKCAERNLPYRIGEMTIEFEGASNVVIFELDSFSIHTQKELERNLHRIEIYGSNTLRNFVHVHTPNVSF